MTGMKRYPLLPQEDGRKRHIWLRPSSIVAIYHAEGAPGCGLVIDVWPETRDTPIGVDLPPETVAEGCL